MTDIVTPEVRSRMMAANRRKDTKPELLVRRYLHAQGFRFRIDVRKLPGSPDIVLARHRAAIFVHGCYWHRHAGCRFAATPRTNIEFWQEKFARNVERDRQTRSALLKLDWRVAVVWECALANGAACSTLGELTKWVCSDEREVELRDLRLS